MPDSQPISIEHGEIVANQLRASGLVGSRDTKLHGPMRVRSCQHCSVINIQGH